MQTRIRVNKSLDKDFKNEFWKGLSLKEVGCFAGAFAALAAAAILSHTLFGIDYVAGVYIGIPFAFPVILLGFKKFHGMSLMKYLEVTKKKRENPVLMKKTGMPEYKAGSFHMTRPKTFAESKGFLYDFSPSEYRKEMIRNFPFSMKKPEGLIPEENYETEQTDRSAGPENKEGIIKMDKKHATILIIVIAVLGLSILAGLGYAGLQVKKHWQEENKKWEYEQQLSAKEEQEYEIGTDVAEVMETETAAAETTAEEAAEEDTTTEAETKEEPDIVKQSVELEDIAVMTYPVITFSKVRGAEGYSVYRKTADSEWTEIASQGSGDYDTSGKSLVYTDQDAESGKDNIYTVRAYVKDEEKTYLSDYDREGLSVFYLAAPVITEANSTEKGVSLSWEEVGGATSYAVYRHTEEEAGQEYTEADLMREVEDTTFTDATAKSGRTYYYCIMAKQKVDKETYTSFDADTAKEVKVK